jgi:hypothetical protein
LKAKSQHPHSSLRASSPRENAMNFPAEKRRQVNSVLLTLFEILNWNRSRRCAVASRPRAKRNGTRGVGAWVFAFCPDFSHFSLNFSAEKSVQFADNPSVPIMTRNTGRFTNT